MVAGRTALNRAAWTLPPFALAMASLRWPSWAWVFIYLANLAGYFEAKR